MMDILLNQSDIGCFFFLFTYSIHYIFPEIKILFSVSNPTSTGSPWITGHQQKQHSVSGEPLTAMEEGGKKGWLLWGKYKCSRSGVNYLVGINNQLSTSFLSITDYRGLTTAPHLDNGGQEDQFAHQTSLSAAICDIKTGQVALDEPSFGGNCYIGSRCRHVTWWYISL